jgi:hypothetical protein
VLAHTLQIVQASTVPLVPHSFHQVSFIHRQCCGFWMVILDPAFVISIPDPGVKKAPDPDPQYWIDKEFQYFTSKKFVLTSPKYDSGSLSRVSDSWTKLFHPGSVSRGQKVLDPRSGSAILAIGTKVLNQRCLVNYCKGDFVYVNVCSRAKPKLPAERKRQVRQISHLVQVR